MNLNKYLPLTETTFYIMVSLREENHGYAVMQNVEKLSGGKVRIAAGTMYGAIENLLKQKLIEGVKIENRRKTYKLTTIGYEVLKLEIERLKHMIKVLDKL